MKKNGYNTNLASEFHVISLLHRLGLDANLTLGNKKAVDIVVVRHAGDAVTIDVKAVVGRVDWLMGNVPSVPRENHFVVLLTYDGKFEDLHHSPRVWVIPHAELVQLVKSAKPPSTMKYVSRSEVTKLTQYENAWGFISGTNAI
ncbi:hypothetical protein [Methylomicrobium lacus]|uniref:hypothetical protein n=1 Tax=Methylomicrobium lacus TaxID=136992 RepID=UPI0035A8CA70